MKSLSTHVYIYWANCYIKHVQFPPKTIISNWKVNNFQTWSKWSKIFNCNNSKCLCNDEFSNLNCSIPSFISI